ncbi:MAG: hypothetical protein A3I63_05485 [Betaproteobacteria bacterium RIFCSPLOWO2_02_FULL_66_14]|nr:MAG: hypothetical protein A3I63_05485 [Betaproteobacteria bacterium RIFCSPLOWO2_02_FULL_66_14]
MSAGDSDLKLHAVDLPVLKCAKGHAAPVHREFMVWLIHELRDRCVPSIAAGEPKGLLFKKYHCACGAELAAKPGRNGSFSFDLAYPESPAFKVEFELPVYKCGGCGKEQARSAKDLAANTPMTIAALNDAAGFPHSG